MTFIELVFRNLVRRKLRSSLTATGVAVAIATVITLVGISQGLTQSAIESFRSHGVDLIVVRAGAMQRMSSSLHEQLSGRIARLSGVAEVIPALTDMVALEGAGPIGVPIHGWPLESRLWKTLHLVRGRTLRAGDSHSAILGDSLAQTLGKDVGDAIEIELKRFRVVGIYESSNLYESGAATVLLPDLQQLMDRNGQVSEFMVSLKQGLPDPASTVAQLRREIDALTDERGLSLGLTAMPTEQYVNHNLELRLARDMAWAVSSIALLIGSVSVLNTMLMAVLERTQEIGVLRAIGWRRRRIIGMIVCESCLLSLVGASLGIASGSLLTAGLSRFPAARGLVRGDTSPTIIAVGLLVATVVGRMGAAYPAYRGAALQPTEALRYE